MILELQPIKLNWLRKSLMKIGQLLTPELSRFFRPNELRNLNKLAQYLLVNYLDGSSSLIFFLPTVFSVKITQRSPKETILDGFLFGSGRNRPPQSRCSVLLVWVQCQKRSFWHCFLILFIKIRFDLVYL